MDLPAWEIVGAALVLAAISALTVAYRGKRAYLPVGWLWYLGMLVPVIGLVQVGRQAMADRYFAEAQYNLGDLLLATGQLDEAVVHLQQAVAIRPTFVPAHNDLAQAWYRQKEFSESRAQWREFLRLQQETLRLRPASVTVRQQTAWLPATCPDDSIRDPAQALKLAQREIDLTGRATPQALDTLAAAQAPAGQPAETLRSAEQALALATAQNLAALIDPLRARIELYRAGAAYRDGSP
jgi:tetratricopeptide (TPR) repeat protein